MHCSVDGCSRPRKYAKRGWCQTHYHRWYRTGSVADPEPRAPDWWALITYRSAHNRVASVFGPARNHQCIDCGNRAHHWSYDGTDRTELEGDLWISGRPYPCRYSRFPEFYVPRCLRCHRRHDGAIRAAKRQYCHVGHRLTDANVYTPPGSNARECRTCRRDNARNRARKQRAELRAKGLSSRGRPLRAID